MTMRHKFQTLLIGILLSVSFMAHAYDAPTALTTSLLSSTQVTLTWSKPVSATGYRVFVDGEKWATLLQPQSGETHKYTITGLTPATAYTVAVQAFAEDGTLSALTPPLALTTPPSLLPPPPSGMTALGALASTLTAPGWSILPTNGWSAEYLLPEHISPALGYASQIVWAPSVQQLLFHGSGHYTPAKMLRYRAAINQWDQGPLALPCANLMFSQIDPTTGLKGCGVHAYSHQTIDTVRGHMYWKNWLNADRQSVYRYDVASQTWSTIPPLPLSIGKPSQMSVLLYFPPLDSLILVSNSAGVTHGGNVYRYNIPTQTWSLLATGLAIGGLHPLGAYDAVHNQLFFGGGNYYQGPNSQALYTLNAAGVVTRLQDIPSAIIFRVVYGVYTVDPVSGEGLVLTTQGTGQTLLYAHNPLTDSWRQLPQPPFPDLRAVNTVATSIPEHGVTLWANYHPGSGRSQIYLYKHAATPDIPPSPPTRMPLMVCHTCQYATPQAAATAAQDGDQIEIAAGVYIGQQAAAHWRANNLTIRGVHGPARMIAGGANIQGKSLWLVSGNDTTIERVELSGTVVPDGNGSGLQLDGRSITLRHSLLADNQSGFRAGGPNNPIRPSHIVLESVEFARNGAHDGQTHNLYVGGQHDSLTLSGSYSHDARGGQLVKSRALKNYIAYNCLVNEDQDATSNYEIDLSNGGESTVIGNVLGQGPHTSNNTLLTFAPEGATQGFHPIQHLKLFYNTFRNAGPATSPFLQTRSGTIPLTLDAGGNQLLGQGRPWVADGVVRELPDDTASAPVPVQRYQHPLRLAQRATTEHGAAAQGCGE